jgi:hypothetical protein
LNKKNNEDKLNVQVDNSIEIVEDERDWVNVTVREEARPTEEEVPKDEAKDNKVKIKQGCDK